MAKGLDFAARSLLNTARESDESYTIRLEVTHSSYTYGKGATQHRYEKRTAITHTRGTV